VTWFGPSGKVAAGCCALAFEAQGGSTGAPSPTAPGIDVQHAPSLGFASQYRRVARRPTVLVRPPTGRIRRTRSKPLSASTATSVIASPIEKHSTTQTRSI
jgi:hypothetical protein